MLITLVEIAKRYPGAKGADTSHPATWVRWIMRGVIGADGERHKLKATRVGSRWMVNELDVDAFFAELGVKAEVARVAADIGSKRSAAERAAREMELAGA